MPLAVAVTVFLAICLVGMRGRAPRHDLGGARLPARAPSHSGAMQPQVEATLGTWGLRLDRRQLIGALGLLGLLGFLLAHRFFGNASVALLVGGLCAGYPYMELQRVEQKRKAKLALQFKDALASIASSLRAGASLHTAVQRAYADLRQIYPAGAREPVVQAVGMLVRQLELGLSVEAVLADSAQAMAVDEISDFVAATLAVKRRGGNLADVMETISESINMKIRGQAQLRALTAEKRSEANLLLVLPAAILVVLTALSPAYMEPLFQTAIGQKLLFLGILLNSLAFLAVRKVLDAPV